MTFRGITQRLFNASNGYYTKVLRTSFHTNTTQLPDESGTGKSPRYTNDQQSKILHVLNNFTPDDISRYNITRSRAEKLHQLRKNGISFINIEQICDVPGIGEQSMTRFCDSILFGTHNADRQGEGAEIRGKRGLKSQLLTPGLEENVKALLSNAVGIHIGLNRVSWASIDRDSTLLEWNFYEMEFGSKKKIHPIDMFAQVLQMRMQLPEADVYILEDGILPNQQTQQHFTSLSAHLEKTHLVSMLLAILNISSKHKSSDPLPPDELLNCNRVHFLRSRASARLFHTLVGNECVSSQSIVDDIITPSRVKDKSNLCYTPVAVAEDLRQYYLDKKGWEREHMSQALLLTMTFMDLILFQTPRSIQAFKK